MDTDDLPVTFSVRWQANPDHLAEFEKVLAGMVKAAAGFDGHLGATAFRPADTAHPEFHVVVKFDTLRHLRLWLDSDERRAWLASAQAHELSGPNVEVLTGLEAWFASPGLDRAPPLWKMSVATACAIFPLITLLRLALGPVLNGYPVAVQCLVLVTILVPLMTYAIMPTWTRWLRPWLFPRSTNSKIAPVHVVTT